ncbi:MAG: B12-binding domain-containing radical SAM protein [Brevefilum sp.]|nr:B12-binding domain-containing radical SAM protein [Brevefilum sp.]MDT8382005.1 B12-binding domain-containing radical SAM protein [Brevefilum sp.]MDW7754601.1 B12-binding domain-containing radical SAM protein [Brevefilum sp.]
MNILLVYPQFPDTFWSFKHALKFVHKKASSPPLGLLTVAAMLPSTWEKRLVDMNVSQLQEKDLAWADMLMISAMTVQRESTQSLISRARALGKIIVAGGPLFTMEPDAFPEVDHLILNEAEITLPQFLSDLGRGDPQRVYKTDAFADITTTPVPLWELADINKYESLSLQFTRGCPFNCDFCNVTSLLGHHMRLKTTQQLIAELDKIYSLGWRRGIFIVDDNFIGNKRTLKQEVLPAMIEWRKGKKGCRFVTEASVNLSDDDELIEMMVKAGFTQVFVGIETPDDLALAECSKSQNRNRDLVSSVKKLQQMGLQVMGGFIVGFDSDDESIFDRMIAFIQESGIVTAMVGLLQAPVGTQLYQRMLREGRISDHYSGDNVDGETNIIPKMDMERLKQGYRKILDSIYSSKGFYERVRTFLKNYTPSPTAVTLQWQEIAALLSSIVEIGIKSDERRDYWKLFFWTLFKHPKKFPLAITFSIYGYHFRKVNELHVS